MFSISTFDRRIQRNICSVYIIVNIYICSFFFHEKKNNNNDHDRQGGGSGGKEHDKHNKKNKTYTCEDRKGTLKRNR